jgi:hypothetical protein
MESRGTKNQVLWQSARANVSNLIGTIAMDSHTSSPSKAKNSTSVEEDEVALEEESATAQPSGIGI